VDYTLQQLRYLVAVADHGSVSAAARSLFVSQPGLSSAVLHLENVFGIKCFNRHHAKGVSLTPAGHLFVEDAREVLLRAAALQQRAQELSQTIAGRLDVGCCSTISPLLIPRILGKLHQMHPDIQVALQDGSGETIQARLQDGVIEVALVFDFAIDPRYERLELVSLAPHVLLPKTHRLAAQSSIELADLLDEPLILFDRPKHAQYLLSLFSGVGRAPTIGQRVGDSELIRSLVAAGKGYALLNARPALDHSYDGSPVACVPISGVVQSATIVVASLPSKSLTSRAAAFIGACRETMEEFDAQSGRWIPPIPALSESSSTCSGLGDWLPPSIRGVSGI
jgi:DNA-binding transcriptional LysR family regulator